MWHYRRVRPQGANKWGKFLDDIPATSSLATTWPAINKNPVGANHPLPYSSGSTASGVFNQASQLNNQAALRQVHHSIAHSLNRAGERVVPTPAPSSDTSRLPCCQEDPTGYDQNVVSYPDPHVPPHHHTHMCRTSSHQGISSSHHVRCVHQTAVDQQLVVHKQPQFHHQEQLRRGHNGQNHQSDNWAKQQPTQQYYKQDQVHESQPCLQPQLQCQQLQQQQQHQQQQHITPTHQQQPLQVHPLAQDITAQLQNSNSSKLPATSKWRNVTPLLAVNGIRQDGLKQPCSTPKQQPSSAKQPCTMAQAAPKANKAKQKKSLKSDKSEGYGSNVHVEIIKTAAGSCPQPAPKLKQTRLSGLLKHKAKSAGDADEMISIDGCIHDAGMLPCSTAASEGAMTGPQKSGKGSRKRPSANGTHKSSGSRVSKQAKQCQHLSEALDLSSELAAASTCIHNAATEDGWAGLQRALASSAACSIGLLYAQEVGGCVQYHTSMQPLTKPQQQLLRKAGAAATKHAHATANTTELDASAAGGLSACSMQVAGLAVLPICNSQPAQASDQLPPHACNINTNDAGVYQSISDVIYYLPLNLTTAAQGIPQQTTALLSQLLQADVKPCFCCDAKAVLCTLQQQCGWGLPAAETLRLVDPCVLAWLYEPQLLQGASAAEQTSNELQCYSLLPLLARYQLVSCNFAYDTGGGSQRGITM